MPSDFSLEGKQVAEYSWEEHLEERVYPIKVRIGRPLRGCLFRLLGFPPFGLVEIDVCRTCHTFLIARSDESVHTVIDVKPDNN
jgi:hypothetical protein